MFSSPFSLTPSTFPRPASPGTSLQAAAASSPAATDARDQEEGDAGGGPDGGLGGALVSQTSTSSAPASLAGLLGARWAALAVQGEEKADTLEVRAPHPSLPHAPVRAVTSEDGSDIPGTN